MIVCGFGRFGRVVVEDLLNAGREVVVLDPDSRLQAEFEEAAIPYVIASGTSDEALERAGIRSAEAIVVATGSEIDCVFITLAARELNPSITIHARSEGEATVRTLRRAGADHVISPLQMVGMRAAATILRPSVVDFLEISSAQHGEEIDMEEISVAADSEIAGEVIEAIERGANLRIVALKRAGQPIEIVPDHSTTITPGDHLVVIGERIQLEALADRAQSSTD